MSQVGVGIGIDTGSGTGVIGSVVIPQPENIPMSWSDGRGGEIAMHWTASGGGDGDRIEWRG